MQKYSISLIIILNRIISCYYDLQSAQNEQKATIINMRSWNVYVTRWMWCVIMVFHIEELSLMHLLQAYSVLCLLLGELRQDLEEAKDNCVLPS